MRGERGMGVVSYSSLTFSSILVSRLSKKIIIPLGVTRSTHAFQTSEGKHQFRRLSVLMRSRLSSMDTAPPPPAPPSPHPPNRHRRTTASHVKGYGKKRKGMETTNSLTAYRHTQISCLFPSLRRHIKYPPK